MSQERDIEVGSTLAPTNEETKEQRYARIAQVLDRGIVSDRLAVSLPSDIHGEWVKNDPIAIERMKALGFEIDTKYAKARGLHDDAGKVAVGDVIHMIAPKELRETIKEYKKKRFNDFYKKRPKITKAEESNIDTFSKENEVEIRNESSVETLTGSELLSTLEREVKK